MSLKQYDTVLPQLTELDKDSNRRRAVLHRKAFDEKYKSTALSDHSLNMLEKLQIVKIKCHVVYMKTKQTRLKLLLISTGLVKTVLPAPCNYTSVTLYSKDSLCIKKDYFGRLKFGKFFQKMAFLLSKPGKINNSLC